MSYTSRHPPNAVVEPHASPRAHLPLLVVSLLVASRVILVLFAEPLAGDDGNRYLREGVNLWTHGVYSDHTGDIMPSAHDLPLYPLLLAGLFALLKSAPLAAKAASLINCALFGGAAWGVFTISARLFGGHALATLAMVMFGCFPGAYPHSVFYMPESLFVCLLVGCVATFLKYLSSARDSTLWGAFVLWGLSILAKPISIAFGFVLAGIAVCEAVRRKRNVAHSVRSVAIGLALGFAVLAPWVARNQATFGVVGISSITGTNPFYCNYLFVLEDIGVPNARAVLDAKAAEILASIPPERSNPMTRARALGTFAEHEILRYLPHYVVTTLKRHPALYMGTGAVDTLRLFGDTEGIAAMEQGLVNRSTWRSAPTRVLALLAGSWLFLCVAYGAAALGFVNMARRRAWTGLAITLSMVVYFAVMIGPVTSARYRFVMLPALSMAAAVGLRPHDSIRYL